MGLLCDMFRVDADAGQVQGWSQGRFRVGVSCNLGACSITGTILSALSCSGLHPHSTLLFPAALRSGAVWEPQRLIPSTFLV